MWCCQKNHFEVKTEENTAKNTVTSSNFLVWKLCVFKKFPHQEIRWIYGIFHSGAELFSAALPLFLITGLLATFDFH